MLAITETKTGIRVCNECFNLLPAEDREGRGAKIVGYAPEDTPTEKCEICSRDAIQLGERD